MKKFKFRLESVRIDRKRTEDFRLREWSIVNRMLNDLFTEKKQIEERITKAFDEMTEIKSAPRISLGIISELENFIQGLKQKLEWKKNEISRAEKFVERKRLDWIQARQKRMILEKLKEKKIEEYKEEKKDKENKDLNDLYLMRARMQVVRDDL